MGAGPLRRHRYKLIAGPYKSELHICECFHISIDINIMAMCAVYAVGGQGTIEGPGDDQ